MLSFDQIRKQYADGTVALEDICCEVPAGQFCVLLGSSGAGKTTLLKTANGMVEPTSGVVRIEGEAFTRRTCKRLRRKISMIHQHFNLVARLAVEQNVLAGALAVLPLWRALFLAYPRELRQRAADLVAQVGLTEGQFQRRAQQLSGGQQQRAGIARAFLMDPPLVLADEPVASLDPKTSDDIMQLLRRAAKSRGSTVLCSLHQVELARRYADRIIGMRGGRVVFDGSAEELSAEVEGRIYGARAEERGRE